MKHFVKNIENDEKNINNEIFKEHFGYQYPLFFAKMSLERQFLKMKTQIKWSILSKKSLTLTNNTYLLNMKNKITKKVYNNIMNSIVIIQSGY